ncbi:MAG: transposase, partial [Burkholderiales bacterium]
GVIDVLLFGIVPGVLILVTQIVWIPFWAAGVINGVGHVFGYRNASTPDASTNIVPWGILIGGEELHNNHHNHPTSARLSSKWYEFDLGWLYIRLFSWLGLARIKRVAPVPHLVAGDAEVGLATVHAVIANRYDVLARYASALRPASIAALGELRPLVSRDAPLQKHANRWLRDHEAAFDAPEHPRLAVLMAGSPVLNTVVSMRGELIALWARSTASQEDLVVQLKAWCKRAESSGIAPLAEFSRHLRRYA